MELDPFDEAAQEALGAWEGDADPPVIPDDFLGQADTEEQEQAEAVIEEPEAEPEVFGDDAPVGDEPEELFELEGETPQAPPAINVESLTFTLPGIDKPVSFQEMRDGYLRQADYTRKTQEVAKQRNENEQAIKLWDAIQADPVNVAKVIAVQAGLLDENAVPVKQIDFSPIRTTVEVEAEINRRVEEAVASHPVVTEAAKVKWDNWLNGEFTRLEQTHQVKLGPKSRQRILRRAAQAQVTDLDLVFQSLMAERNAKQAAAEAVRNAAPSRPSPRTAKRELVEDPESWEEAARRAFVTTQ